MARKARNHSPGYTQHVIQRGSNRATCFFVERDYEVYLELLQRAADETGCEVHAYVLMTNHVHLLVTPRVYGGISQLMKTVAQGYTQRMNYRHQRTGPLWEGRYKAMVIDTEAYLLACYRYIESNPVRAGMVKRASEYRWSSARCHGLGEPDGVVVDHPLYDALGPTPEARQRAYRGLFASG